MIDILYRNQSYPPSVNCVACALDSPQSLSTNALHGRLYPQGGIHGGLVFVRSSKQVYGLNGSGWATMGRLSVENSLPVQRCGREMLAI